MITGLPSLQETRDTQPRQHHAPTAVMSRLVSPTTTSSRYKSFSSTYLVTDWTDHMDLFASAGGSHSAGTNAASTYFPTSLDELATLSPQTSGPCAAIGSLDHDIEMMLDPNQGANTETLTDLHGSVAPGDFQTDKVDGQDSMMSSSHLMNIPQATASLSTAVDWFLTTPAPVPDPSSDVDKAGGMFSAQEPSFSRSTVGQPQSRPARTTCDYLDTTLSLLRTLTPGTGLAQENRSSQNRLHSLPSFDSVIAQNDFALDARFHLRAHVRD
ncbi:hypothetical protein LTR81_020064 [Elasticomyces elasticus]